jgi:hypothetical protein
MLGRMYRKQTTYNSSPNVFGDGAVLLGSVIWTLYIVFMFFLTTTFQGMVLPSLSGETYSVGFGQPIEASSINRTQQSRFHLRTREEPSLETLWFQNIRTMDKVQIIDRSKKDIIQMKQFTMSHTTNDVAATVLPKTSIPKILSSNLSGPPPIVRQFLLRFS